MAISIIRISVLIALSFVGFIGLCGEPLDDSATWFTDFFLSKGIAALCFYGLYRLYPMWVKTDKWIGAYDRWSSKGVEDC